MKTFFDRYKKIIAAAVLWLAVFLIYLNTMAPSVGFIDSGELAADVITLGIAHPTGYPLFTMLGRIFSLLPIANEEIVRLNILSALLTSLASCVFFFFVTELLDEGKKEHRSMIIIASLFSSLLLSFSRTFWFQGLAIEVYSLHLLLTCSAMLIFVKAVKSGEARWWLLFAFTVGLSFTNHLTTVLLAPAMLFWFFAEHGLTKNAFKKILVLALPFLTGLSVYLYLPIRAAQQPLFNWGNPQTVEKIWGHVTGKQFRVFMFSSGEAAKKQLDYFINNLTNEFFIVALALAAAGFFVLLFSNRRKFFFVSLIFITCVGYSINYDIHDIDSYFLLAFISIAVFIAFGIEKILRQFEHPFVKSIIITSLAIILGFQAVENRTKVDQHSNYLVEDYTKNILTNLPPNSIVLSYQWDYFVAATYYFQHVKNIRTDVVVIDKELLRRSWYFPQLEKMYPTVMQKSKVESELFLQELYKFEHDLPYNYAAIEGSYAALIKSFIVKNDSVPFYVTHEIEPEYTMPFVRIPENFLFRVQKDTTYAPVPFPVFNYRGFAGADIYAQQIKLFTVKALVWRGMYEQQHGRDSLSQLYRQKASEIR